jgi:hypothetical protein
MCIRTLKFWANIVFNPEITKYFDGVKILDYINVKYKFNTGKIDVRISVRHRSIVTDLNNGDNRL